MMMGWGFFPWPVLFMVLMMLTMAGFMALGPGRGAMGPGCGFGARRSTHSRPTPAPAPPDPMVTLRDRYVRGEIDTPEFERRLEGLLGSDPTAWSDR
ncbi:MAG: hypothetical protein NVS3B21_30000 [Acidimicrobiales bacterium]